MAVSAAVVTVGTTPTLLTGSESDALLGSHIVVNNTSAVTVYIGGSAVTIATGFPVAAGVTTVRFELGPNEAMYGVVAAATAAVAAIRVGV